MANTKTILVGTDFSRFSHRAEKRAAMLCADLEYGGIELLTVREGGLPEAVALVLGKTSTETEAILAERAMRELRLTCANLEDNQDIRCTSMVKFGRPEQEIVARADELFADLTVIGAHGGNFFTDLFLGNTADKLARMSKTPLLVVKNQTVEPYRQILVPVDFSANSRRAAQLALRVAPDAHITFMHVFDVVVEEQMQYVNVAREVIHEYHVKAAEDARRDLNEFIAGLPGGNHSVARIVVFGNPGHVIYDHANSLKPDLIVLGKHGRTRFEELLLGSTSRHVLEQCFCDVLIVTAPV